jgi:hypothetical protein
MPITSAIKIIIARFTGLMFPNTLKLLKHIKTMVVISRIARKLAYRVSVNDSDSKSKTYSSETQTLLYVVFLLYKVEKR